MIKETGEDKFWEFWENYRDKLYKICLRIMRGNKMEAEDALGEAMMRAREKMVPAIRGIENPKAWLSRLTNNVCIDILRRDRKIEFFGAALDDYEPIVTSGDIYKEPMEERQECREALQSLLRAIKQLPTHLKEPAILRLLIKMQYRDIAQRLQISCDNARQRMHSAQAILRDELGTFSGEILCFGQLEWDEIEHFLETEIGPPKPEIDMRVAYITITNLMQGEMERSTYIFLEQHSPRAYLRQHTLLNYIARHPGGWKKRAELAEILYTQGDWDQSIHQLEMVIQKNPLAISSYLRLGQMLKDTGFCRQAARVYRKASSYVQKKSSTHFLNGMWEFCHSNKQAAIRELNTAIKLEPENTTFLNALALIYLEEDFSHQAVEFFERTMEIDSGDLVALMLIYDPLLAIDCKHRAEMAVDRLLHLHPCNIPALQRKILHACLKGHIHGEAAQQTRKLLRKLKHIAPRFHGTFEALAAYYFARGEQRMALGILEDYTLAHPKSYDGLYNYSVWLFRCGNIQKASRIILRLLTIDEKNLKTLLTAGEIFRVVKDLNLLHRIIEAIQRYHPNSWRGCCFRGQQLAIRYNDMQGAEQCFRRAIQLQPAIPEAYVYLARNLTLRQNFASALEALETARSHIPGDECRIQSTRIAFLTAEICRCMEKRDDENHWLKLGLKQAELLAKSEPAVGYYWKGKIMQKMDDSAASHEMFRLALRFAPFFPLSNEIKEILAKNRKAALKS